MLSQYSQSITPLNGYAAPALSLVGATEVALSLLPRDWFSDEARSPGGVVYNLIFGICTEVADLHGQVTADKLCARLPTSEGGDVDSWVADFFGNNLLRNPGESDTAYISRAQTLLGAKRSVKSGVISVAGYYGASTAVEPFQAAQMGALGTPALAFGSPTGGIASMKPAPQLYINAALDTTTAKHAKSQIMAARPCGMNLSIFQVNATNATAL